MSLLRSLSLLALGLALGACNKGTDAPDQAAASATTDAAATAASTTPVQPATTAAEVQAPKVDLGGFHIVSVLLGTAVDADNVVMSETDVFTSKDPIYASVLSTGSHQGLRITAKWLAPDGSTVAEKAQAVVPTSATATTFRISNPQAWPPGEYQVQIAINGETLSSKKFKVL